VHVDDAAVAHNLSLRWSPLPYRPGRSALA
jgi:hypothetical protein